MSTAEDVFHIYERNSKLYFTCKEWKHCPTQFNRCCYCSENMEIRPFTIGNQDKKCTFNNKCYVRPGDECSICYEPILTKRTSFLTDCGHSYHRKCLFAYIQNKWQSSSCISVVKCPLCRRSIGEQVFQSRYRSSYFLGGTENVHGLDRLEDFWLCHEFNLPEFCRNKYNHYLGFSSTCKTCNLYNTKGLTPI